MTYDLVSSVLNCKYRRFLWTKRVDAQHSERKKMTVCCERVPTAILVKFGSQVSFASVLRNEVE